MIRQVTRVTACLVAVMVVEASASQNPQVQNPNDPVGSAIIMGRVVVDETNEPVAGVRVTRWLFPTGGSFQHEVISDARGRFLFTRVGAGQYKLVAEMPGYAMGAYGRKRASGPDQLVQVADGVQMKDVVLRLFRSTPEQLTGSVRDEFGDPVVGITLYPVRVTPGVSGPPAYGYASAVQTDDRGEFRMFVSPGKYGIVVPPSATISMPAGIRNGPAKPSLRDGDLHVFFADPPKRTPAAVLNDNALVYALTAYPAGLFEDASESITIVPDGPPQHVNIRLASARGARVSGTVTGSDGPLRDVDVRMTPAFAPRMGSATPSAFDGGLARTDAQGRFTFVGVAPGRYDVEVFDVPKVATATSSDGIDTPAGTLAMSTPVSATARAPVGPTHWASVPVTVTGSDIDGLAISTKRGARGIGRVTFDGVNNERPSAAALARLTVWWQSFGDSALSMPTYPISSSDEFQTAEYPAGQYVIGALLPTGWVVASATYRDRDVMSKPIELDGQDATGIVVTVTNKVGTLKGTVRRPDGSVERDATVYVLESGAEYVLNRIVPAYSSRTAGPGDDGTFTLTGLRPGNYRVLAVSESTSQITADMFKLIKSAGTSITVAPLQTATVDIRSVPLPGGAY